MKKIVTSLFLLVGILHTSQAQWTNDATANTPVCVYAENQEKPVLCTDGAGGAIIAWEDLRTSSSGIYVQRIDANGIVKWTANGFSLNANVKNIAIVSDGSGGAIITWQDYRNGIGNLDIYAQRLNANGIEQWQASGVVVCNATLDQSMPAIASDGSSGAIICWGDNRTSSTTSLYTQRINSSGIVQWIGNGVLVCTTINASEQTKITSDGSNGAIYTWTDVRLTSDENVYAQRVNASGAVQWAANGVAICTFNGDQFEPSIATDGNGGAFITWVDYRQGVYFDIFAQHVLNNGTLQANANGIIVCSASSDQYGPQIISVGSGEAIITWYDARNGATGYDIYAQKITSSGALSWTPNGNLVCNAQDDQDYPCITKDGSGGAIISWHVNNANEDLFAQRINTSGAIQWTPAGVPICTATGKQGYPQIVADASGGAIITWADRRNGSNNDIYTQHVMSNGLLSVGTHTIDISNQIQIVPNPSNGKYFIESNYPIDNITILDIQGRVVMNTTKNKKKEIDISTNTNGIYVVNMALNIEGKSIVISKYLHLNR